MQTIAITSGIYPWIWLFTCFTKEKVQGFQEELPKQEIEENIFSLQPLASSHLNIMDTFPLLRASYRTFLSLPFNLEYHCIFSSSEVGWQQFSVHFFVIKIKLGMMSFCKRKRELKISRKSQSTAKKTFGKGWGCLNLHSSHSGPAVFLFFSHTHLVSRWSILKC